MFSLSAFMFQGSILMSVFHAARAVNGTLGADFNYYQVTRMKLTKHLGLINRIIPYHKVSPLFEHDKLNINYRVTHTKRKCKHTFTHNHTCARPCAHANSRTPAPTGENGLAVVLVRRAHWSTRLQLVGLFAVRERAKRYGDQHALDICAQHYMCKTL